MLSPDFWWALYIIFRLWKTITIMGNVSLIPVKIFFLSLYDPFFTVQKLYFLN